MSTRRVYPEIRRREFSRRFTLSSAEGGFAPILIVIVVMSLFALAAIAIWKFEPKIQNISQQPQSEQTAETSQATQLSTPSPVTLPSQQPLSEVKITDLMAKWNIYTSPDNSYTFKYPEKWYVKVQTNDDIEFASDYSQFLLKIYKGSKIKSYEDYPKCGTINEGTVAICVDEEPSNTFLGLKPAKSFIIRATGPGYLRRSVQTTINPKIELNMDLTGGGLGGTFDLILSTFRFIN